MAIAGAEPAASQKPKPANFPTSDPPAFLALLFDSYANRENRAGNATSSILHPILAPVEKLPRDMCFVIGAVDILLHEQLAFAERLKKEIEAEGDGRRLQIRVFDEGFHGWLELPAGVIDEKSRTDAFDTAVNFIKTTHQNHGWVLQG